MSSRRKWGKAARTPKGYEVIEAVIEAFDNENRDKVKESNAGKRNTESLWPVHQIAWQRSRYVYDMFYTYRRISREVYDYCIKFKIADAALIAKWKKPGYEKLCSTYVINPSNYKFGTTSICRVPLTDRSEMQKSAQDPTTGCLGCASGKDAGHKNIFGNKYGQNLAAVQIAREKRMEAIKIRKEQQQKVYDDASKAGLYEHTTATLAQSADPGAGDSETDDSSDEEDYGPSPTAGVWAGSTRLEAESENIINSDEDDNFSKENGKRESGGFDAGESRNLKKSRIE